MVPTVVIASRRC